jgi:hypothetical protein
MGEISFGYSHRWATTVDMMYMHVIDELEADTRCGSTVQCILAGGDGPYGHLEETLERALLLMLHMEGMFTSPFPYFVQAGYRYQTQATACIPRYPLCLKTSLDTNYLQLTQSLQ